MYCTATKPAVYYEVSVRLSKILLKDDNVVTRLSPFGNPGPGMSECVAIYINFAAFKRSAMKNNCNCCTEDNKKV